MTDAIDSTPTPAPTPRTFSEQLDGVFGNARAKVKFFEVLSRSIVELVSKLQAPLARKVEAQAKSADKVGAILADLAEVNTALAGRVRALERRLAEREDADHAAGP